MWDEKNFYPRTFLRAVLVDGTLTLAPSESASPDR